MKVSKNYFFYLIFFCFLVQVSNLPALVRQPNLAIENARLKAQIRELEAKLRGTQIPALESEITRLKRELTVLRARPAGVPGAPGVGADFFTKHAGLIKKIEGVEARLEKEKQDSIQTGKRLFALMKAMNRNAMENISLQKKIRTIEGGVKASVTTKKTVTEEEEWEEDEEEE